MHLIDTDDPATRTMTPGLWVIWAVWTVGVLVLLSSHEMWRDELQAWAIARDSSSPLDLLGNLRYEGHPPGWHIPLWIGAKVNAAPAVSMLITGACGSGATWIVLRYLPYTLLVRVLLIAGYFPLYEFGSISRSYGLLYLLAVAFLALADRRTGWSLGLIALLLALAATLATALPLVVALAVGHWIRRRDPRAWSAIAVGSALTVASVLVVLHSWAPSDGRIMDVQIPGADQLDRVLRAPTRILVPLPEFVLDFWGQFLSDRLGWVEVALGVAVLIGFGLLVRRSRAALTVWIIAAGGYLLPVAALDLPLAPRHMSVLWISALAALWIAGSDAAARRESTPPTRTSPVPKVLATSALVVAVLAAGWASYVELNEPFSGGEGAAEWIEEQAAGSPVTVLCATKAYLCSTVAIRLDEPAFMRSDVEPFTFVTWRRNRPGHTTGTELVDEARTVEELTGREVMIVASYNNMPPGCEAGWVSEPTIVAGERMVVCRADQLAEVAATP